MVRICLNCGHVMQRGGCAGCRQRWGITPVEPGVREHEETRWQHTPVGRIVVGLLLAQGLAHGLRMFFNAGLQAAGEAGEDSLGAVGGVLLMQSLHGICLLLAGALAGAGQHAGLLIGSVVGLFNGLILLLVQRAGGEPMTPLVCYGQPLFHLICGALGGWIGSTIWKPLPRITLAAALERRAGRAPGPGPRLFAGPVAWFRVLVGSFIIVPVVFCSPILLRHFLDLGHGQFQVNTHFETRMLILEIAVLGILLGSTFAGANTFNGAKQGLVSGLISAVIVSGLQFGSASLPLNLILGIAVCVVILSVAGGWFGSRLLPPVAPSNYRRRLSDA